jgi:hypothetical protein
MDADLIFATMRRDAEKEGDDWNGKATKAMLVRFQLKCTAILIEHYDVMKKRLDAAEEQVAEMQGRLERMNARLTVAGGKE